MNTNIPRGLRNNNPLNIRKSSTKWQGEIQGDDASFCTFSDIFWGCRAAIKNLITHVQQDKRRLIRTTIEREVTRWAPSSENNTSAYLNWVCDYIKLPPTTIIMPNDKNLICMLLHAMARYENGLSAEVHYYWFERAYEMLHSTCTVDATDHSAQ